MKPFTNNILDILHASDFLENLKFIKSLNVQAEHLEMTVNEAIEVTEKNINIFNESIVVGLLDEIGLNKRTNLHNFWGELRGAVSNFRVNQHGTYAQQIITQTQNISDFIREYNIEAELKKFPGYTTQKKDLKDLINEYKGAVEKVKNIESFHSTAQNILNNFETKNDEVNTAYIKIEEILTNAATKEKAVESKNAQVEKVYDEVEKANQDIANKKVSITAFFENIQTYETKIGDFLKKGEAFIDQKSEDYDVYTEKWKEESNALIELNKASTKSIIEENKKLQGQIKELLQGANAGRLFKSFNKRKTELEKQQKWWLLGVCSVNLLIFSFSIWIIEHYNAGEFNVMMLKIVASLPLIILDWFLIAQYSEIKKLTEEYAFKAAVSLSLIPYYELIKGEGENESTLDFINKAVDNIYSHPTGPSVKGINLDKDIKEKLNSFLDKTADVASDIIKSKASK